MQQVQVVLPAAPFKFSLPPGLEAHEPPEFRGMRRDNVRLMVLPRSGGDALHTRFEALGEFLREGDVLVVNSSRTIPGLLRGRDEHGAAIEVRLAHRRSESRWDALLLQGRRRVGRAGMVLDFGGHLSALVQDRCSDLPFLWQLQFDRCCLELLDEIYRLGEPVRYDYVRDALPLDLYQTVYASSPGSVEMPSAGRALTWQALLRLRRRGVGFTSIMLHTGLSSTRDDELDSTHPNYEEEYEVPESTAALINETHERGGRIIAVGTTVVRALENVADRNGQVRANRGWTNLHIDARHQIQAVDGLLTGLHEPRASHLEMLSAFVEPARLQTAYLEAIEKGYLWHEFGDANLIV